MRFKRRFHLRTHRQYTERGGKYSFYMWNKKNIVCQLKQYKEVWEKIIPGKNISDGLLAKSGVYVVVMFDKKRKSNDVCYVGSSKNIGLRICSHSVVAFLTRKLDDHMGFYIFVSYDENFKELEKSLIREFRPFLNINMESANHLIYF